MTRRFLILMLLFLPAALKCNSQSITSDDKLRQIINRDGQAEVTLPFTDKRSVEILTINVSVLSIKENIIYISLSRLTIDWFINQRYNYRILEKEVAARALSAVSMSQASEWGAYPSYTQYDSIMQNFPKLYPSLCRLDTIGTSVKGKLVLALKISVNPGVDGSKPAVFYTSTIHGDEPAGFVLMLHLADYLLKNYSLSGRVKNLVDNLDIWINPLANPDGTYNHGDTINLPTRYNANGYDLNRNFPDPVTPNTVLQKETIDMIRFLKKHRFVISANFHTGEEVFNYPWDRWPRLHADNDWFVSIGRKYADTVHLNAVSGYMTYLNNGITDGYQWYPVYGGRQDFVTYSLQGREVTIELDNESVSPASQLPLLWQYNWHSFLGYFENALYGIHGLVRDAKTNAPVPAKVFINGYDKDSSQVYSDTLNGSFERFLSPGSWNLTFSAVGYWPVNINNVIVTEGQKTDLIVDMSQIASGIEPVNSTSKLILYPNPANDILNILLPGKTMGRMNLRVINQFGELIEDYDTEVDQEVPVLIDVKHLSSGIYTIIITDINTRSRFSGRFVVVK
jgi:Zinc carboxypeptidase/Secretion system C-terminal sorting domain/Carboxypeptidase regulatory-like domain